MSVRFITHQSFFSAVRSGDLTSVKEAVKDDGSDSDHPAAAASISSGLMELQNDNGETALYVAAESNHEEVFSYLLKFCHLQTVLIKSKVSGLDAFHVAAKNGHLGIYIYIYTYTFLIYYFLLPNLDNCVQSLNLIIC